MTDVLTKRGTWTKTQTCTERRVCEGTQRKCHVKMKYWSNAFTSQGIVKIVGKLPIIRNRQERILPYSFQRDHGPVDTLISDC